MKNKLELICPHCGIVFYRYKSTLKPNQLLVYCCKDHYIKHSQKMGKFLGENNNNYGNRWSEEQRQKSSDMMKLKVNDDFRWKMGAARRGKKFILSDSHKANIRKNNQTRNYQHSAKSKLLIGKKSSEKFTPEYKQKQRNKLELNGRWIPLKEKTDYQIYCKQSQWVGKMWDKISDLEQVKKLQQLGVFDARMNPKGVIRDHCLGRRIGFNLGIFPEILRHPCNCQIITHSENVSKGFHQEQGITPTDLFARIKAHVGDWKEQSVVLNLIERYNIGERWNNPYKEINNE